MKIECTKQELATMVVNCKSINGDCDWCVLNGVCPAHDTLEGLDKGRENYQYLVDKCDVIY